MAEPAIAKQHETVDSSANSAWARVQDLVCHLTVELRIPGVKVRDMVRLELDTVIESRWQVSADVPLRVNGELVAWSEFEVVGDRLAVRLTELA